MKHPEELKTKFLELRAQGVSYGRIAEAIGVSKPTLIQWGKAMAEEIADLQAAERELVREKLLGNFEQWLGRQVHHFNRLDAEFGRREFKYSPTESVFRMMMASRKLLDRYFFEDDRPRQRRASEGRAPSRPATAAAAEAIPLPRAAETQSLGRSSTGSELGTGEGQTGNPASLSGAAETESLAADATSPGQDEGDSGSFSSADRKNSNPSSEIESVTGSPCLSVETGVSPLLPRGEGRDERQTRSSGSAAYSENPAKTQPFPSQNSTVDNGNLSQSAKSEGRAPSSPQTPPELQTKPSDAENDFGGESVPVNPFESTRQWLERQGIQVSKVPKGARIITAA
jgi:hypothetical protein